MPRWRRPMAATGWAGDDRGTRHTLALIVGIVLLGGCLWCVRWVIDDQHASGDTFWYARSALQYAGEPASEATADAARYIVSQGRGSDATAWIRAAGTIDPRYPAIFESRPVYSLVAAAFVPIAGLTAMTVSAFLAGLVFSLALGLLAYAVTRSMLAAAVALVAAYALPSGGWLAFLYADGWMMASLVATLACATAYLRSGARGWLVGVAICLTVLYLSKSANGAVLVAAVALLAAYTVASRSPDRTRVMILAMTATGLGIAQIVVFALVGAPGLWETLQDLFTHHFSSPDVADPVRQLIRVDVHLLPRLIVGLLTDPVALLLLSLVILGLVPLAIVRTRWAQLWALAGISTLLTILVHPVTSEIPRLIAPVWVSVAFGAALWVHLFDRRWFRRSERGSNERPSASAAERP